MPTQYVVLAVSKVPRIFLDIIYIYPHARVSQISMVLGSMGLASLTQSQLL